MIAKTKKTAARGQSPKKQGDKTARRRSRAAVTAPPQSGRRARASRFRSHVNLKWGRTMCCGQRRLSVFAVKLRKARNGRIQCLPQCRFGIVCNG